MTEPEVIKLLGIIVSAYPHMRDIPRQMVKIWSQSLKDIPLEVGLANVEKHIKTNKFPPSIAEVRGDVDKNNRFHNFKQYSDRYTEEQIEQICQRKREKYLKSIKGEWKMIGGKTNER